MKGKHPVPSEICLHRSRLDSVAIGEAAPIVTEGNHQAKRLANAANAYARGGVRCWTRGGVALVFGATGWLQLRDVPNTYGRT